MRVVFRLWLPDQEEESAEFEMDMNVIPIVGDIISINDKEEVPALYREMYYEVRLREFSFWSEEEYLVIDCFLSYKVTTYEQREYLKNLNRPSS